MRRRPSCRVVHKALHRPLTVCGVDRRLFFLALIMGALCDTVESAKLELWESNEECSGEPDHSATGDEGEASLLLW